METITVCVTGHRPNKLYGYGNDPRYQELSRIFQEYLLEYHVTDTWTGMALGVDQIFAKSVLELKRQGVAIRLHCAIPCQHQDRYWPPESKKRYQTILEHADEVKMVSNQSYTPWCMNVRNHYMVDHSDRVLAVWDGSSGGTKNCIDYAKEKMVPVDFILPKPYPTRKEEN